MLHVRGNVSTYQCHEWKSSAVERVELSTNILRNQNGKSGYYHPEWEAPQISTQLLCASQWLFQPEVGDSLQVVDNYMWISPNPISFQLRYANNVKSHSNIDILFKILLRLDYLFFMVFLKYFTVTVQVKNFYCKWGYFLNFFFFGIF